MDFNTLRDQVSNLTIYDLKAGVRKVQNAVMNFTEMEAKVREATNNEPWGASSTLMQEIANGTFNYQLLNEIMPMIYKRFTEKSAEEWRQIYKALQLLEYLIKNGSERVIDDVRSHLSLLKMLKQFHYTDMNGKDQGINIRNRAKELAELLSDVDRIRAERKKARTTRNKYGGVEGGAGFGGGGFSGSNRYGGFGREDASFGGYSGGVYGDGGGFGGNTSGFSDTQSRRDKFEEYDEYDEGDVQSPTRGKASSSSATVSGAAKKAEPPKPKEPEVDLFSFGEEEPTATTQPKSSQPAGSSLDNFGSMGASNAADDDDFDDFQSAGPSIPAPQKQSNGFGALSPPSTAAFTSVSTNSIVSQPTSTSQSTGLDDLLSTGASSSSGAGNASNMTSSPGSGLNSMQQQAIKPKGFQAAQPNYFTSVSIGDKQATGQPSKGVMSGTGASGPGISNGSKSSSGDAFSSLLEGTPIKKAGTPGQKGMTMADMAKQKATAGIWGASSQQTSAIPYGAPQAGGKAGGGSGGGLDDLLG